ncbi:hypothetical protein J3A83DRAFT_1829191 [Scleroderma citrinum]
MDRVVQEELFLRQPSSSTTRDRPTRTPFGPRIRTRPKNSFDIGPVSSSVDGSSPSASTLTSPTFTSSLSRPSSPAYEHPSNSIQASLFSATPQLQLSIPSLQEEEVDTSSALFHMVDVAIQVPSSPPSAEPGPSRLSPHIPPRTSVSPKASTGTFIAPAPLPSFPTISFESTPIPWKGLPLDAAQWTLTSSELQDIVSRAIRLSAKESFIRLLSLQALDTDIVEEERRLSNERLSAQARWRFEVSRRTMLIQALNSTATVLSSTPEGDKDNTLGPLITQLATIIASCDTQMSTILHIMDQQTQVSSLQHRHWSSALSIALRKLNKTCERQADELKRTLSKIQSLEDELDEAWKEAEAVAVELDAMKGDDDASDGKAETDGESEGIANQDNRHDSQALEDVTIMSDIGEVVGVTATAVISKATLVSPTSPNYNLDKSDAKSVRSTKSTKTTRSKRSARDAQSRLSRVSAARVRSRAASNASLRLPRNIRTPTSGVNQSASPPPIPVVPDTLQGHSFLDMGNVANEFVRPLRKWLPKRQPEPRSGLPDVPRPEKPSMKARAPSIRLTGADGSWSQSQSVFSPSGNRLNARRNNLVGSVSNSDPGPSSPLSVHERAELRVERPGSAGARLVYNFNDESGKSSLVSRASSMLRRLSQATGSRHRSASILSTPRVKEEDEESILPSFLPPAD